MHQAAWFWEIGGNQGTQMKPMLTQREYAYANKENKSYYFLLICDKTT